MAAVRGDGGRHVAPVAPDVLPVRLLPRGGRLDAAAAAEVLSRAQALVERLRNPPE
jgi:hypothetical protein